MIPLSFFFVISMNGRISGAVYQKTMKSQGNPHAIFKLVGLRDAGALDKRG